MLLQIIQKQSAWGKLLLLSCDECGTHFEREYQKFQIDKSHHFCSRSCMSISKRRGGVLFQKISSTCVEKYGVGNSFTLAHIRGTAIRSFEGESVRKRAQEAKRAAGKVFVSKLEFRFVCRLIELFGDENIKRQVYINGRFIDVFVTSQNLYIQFDGSHYHGLNHKSLMYENVRSKVVCDRIQDEWFFKNKLCLLRISDKIAKMISNDEIVNLVEYASTNENFVTYAFGDVEVPH